MSSTTPISPWNSTRSPMRIGWVMASRIPAMQLASVCRAAKPTINPSTADDASTPAAARLTAVNCISPSETPITRIPTNTSRRSSRRRVSATADSSPPGWTKPASLAPRRTSARSITSASATEDRIVAIAVISLRWSVQNAVATGRMAPGMTKEGTRVKAVLLDGMGTLLRLEPPAPALARALGIDLATAEAAFRAEVAYYLEHQLEGSDTDALDDLRRRSAAVLAAAAGVDAAAALDALIGALRFHAFDDAAPALAELRERGLRLVVCSNWDCSLPDVLAEVGLFDLVDGVVASATAGVAKPDPRIFRVALAAAGCDAAEAVHVGDSAVNDAAGARGAGVRALLLDREGGGDLRT